MTDTRRFDPWRGAFIEGRWFGNHRAALGALLEWHVASPDDAPHLWLEFVEVAQRSVPGLLAEDDEAERRIVALAHGARAATRDLRATLGRLLHVDDAEPYAELTFPVVVEHTPDVEREIAAASGRDRGEPTTIGGVASLGPPIGACREIRVVAAEHPSYAGTPVDLTRMEWRSPFGHGPIRDPAFLAACRAAIGWVHRNLRAYLPPRGSYRFEIVPDVPSNTWLSDDSVGLAALAAFASYATRRRLRGGHAATGALVDDAIAAVDGIPQKATVIASERPHVATLFRPADGPSLLRRRPRLAMRKEPLAVLEALIPGVRALHAEGLRSAPTDGDARDRVADRLLALLHAAGGSLGADELDRALNCWGDEETQPTDALSSIPSLRWLEETNVVTIADGRVTLTGRADGPGATMKILAHAALARMVAAVRGASSRACLAEAALHRHAAGDVVRRDEALYALAGIAPGAAFDAASTIAARDGGLPSLDSFLSLLETRDAGHGTPRDILALALALQGLPSPFRRLAERLCAATSDLDRLLLLHGVTWGLLHVLFCVALRHPAAPAGVLSREDRATNARRPSIGSLWSAFRRYSADGRRRRQGGAVELDPRWQPFATLAADPDLGDVVARLNRAMHRLEAWDQLVLRDRRVEAVRSEAARAVADVTERLTAAVRRAGHVFGGTSLAWDGEDRPPAERVGVEGGAEAPVPLEGLVVPVPGEPDRVALFRGAADGFVHWWALDGPECWTAPLSTGPDPLEPTDLLLRPRTAARLAAGWRPVPLFVPEAAATPAVDVERLPSPLARIVRKLGAAAGVQRFAWVDVGLAVWLRLLYLPLWLVEARPPFSLLDRLKRHDEPNWSVLPRRRLSEALRDLAGRGKAFRSDVHERFCAYVSEPDTQKRLTDVVDGIDRIAHHPAPMDDNAGRVDWIVARFLGLVGSGPWSGADGSAVVLAGCRADGRVLHLRGLTAEPRQGPPADGLAGGEIAFRREDGRAPSLPFGPFARLAADASPWLLVNAGRARGRRGTRERHASLFHVGYQGLDLDRRHFRWTASPHAPPYGVTIQER